jgi:hypothetical protein
MRMFGCGRGVLAVMTLIVPTLLSCRQIVGIKSGPSGCIDPLMIDDLEDGDRFICNSSASDGRNGVWITLGDGSSTGTLMPTTEDFKPTLIDDGRPESRFAAHFRGSGFTDWGAFMGLELTNEAATSGAPYDATRVQGITFLMKSNTAVSVSIGQPETTPPSRGGTCQDLLCDPGFQFRISAPDSTGWLPYMVPFASLTQITPGRPRNPILGTATWDPKSILGVAFRVDPGATFDVWVDDVAFYHCANCVPTCPASLPQGCNFKAPLSPAACWPAGTECSALPTCTDPAAPIGCPANGQFPAGCARVGTDCFSMSYFGIWGAAADDIWVVGSRGTIVHGVDTTWSVVAKSGTTQDLLGVWGSAPDDVWAVGLRGTIVHHSVGTSWSAVASNTTNHLESVWGSAPGDVWAVGGAGTIVHWDGSSWMVSGSGTTQDLFAVWGSAADDVWAVGFAGTIVHWDGKSWTLSPIDSTELLLGVWGTGRDDVWAVGHLGIVLHWTNSKWTTSISGTNEALHGIWGSSAPDDLWIVGDNVVLQGVGVGAAFQWLPVDVGITQALQGEWGAGPGDGWAAGFGDTILHRVGTTWSDPRR